MSVFGSDQPLSDIISSQSLLPAAHFTVSWEIHPNPTDQDFLSYIMLLHFGNEVRL